MSELREHQNDTLLRFLAEAGRPCTSAELAEALGLADGRTVAWHLRHLAKERRIRAFRIGGLRVYSARTANSQSEEPT